MKLKEIVNYLQELAPPSLQETYDNSGLIVGNLEMEIKAALICLDSTEAVIEEAKHLGCNLVIAHHPIVFSGLKRFTGENYIERTVMMAIRENIAIYAIHTNLDNVLNAVNGEVARRLGLGNCQVLLPKKDHLLQLVVYCPEKTADQVREAMFEAGAGHISNYDRCSFVTEGKGTFRANEGANPTVGEIGETRNDPEWKMEFILPSWKLSDVLAAMKSAHSYEEVAHQIYRLENVSSDIGAGLIGHLPAPVNAIEFLNSLKKSLGVEVVRHSPLVSETIQRVAVCGGSGSFLLSKAMSAKADVFISADFKYHQFFDADNRIVIADIGHYESEQFTMNFLAVQLKENFPNFALHLTSVDTNPIKYL